MMRTPGQRTAVLALLLATLCLPSGGLTAAPDRIPVDGPISAAALPQALADAPAGATLHVDGGRLVGGVTIDRPVTLVGHNNPIIDGGGVGTVVNVDAPDVTLTGFVIRNSGTSLDEENAGIAITAPRGTVRGNRLENTLFGVYLREASGTRVVGNVIRSLPVEVPRRGDPVRVWYSDDVTIGGNDIRDGRDVVLWYSERLRVVGNDVVGGRYGLHFMYCDDALIEGNRLQGNSVGAFLMYSRRLQLTGNTIVSNRGPSGYGVGLKDMDDAIVRGNLFVDNRVGAYLDNSPRETESEGIFVGNVFAFNDIGVNMLPSVRHNRFSENSFVENDIQVSVAGGGLLPDNVWSEGGRGNYWSDYAGFDADGDGRGDIAYRAERLFENMMERQPALRLYLYSPAALAIDFAARAFPLVRPVPKVVDEAPLMRPLSLEEVPRPAPAPVRSGAWLLPGALLFLLAVHRFRFRPDSVAKKPDGRLAHEEVAMIVVSNLTKRFGGLTAVDGVSFTVNMGEAVALRGPNGAGKTTLLRCLLNMTSYSGQIQVAGSDLKREGRAARRLIGFVPQELSFHDDLTVQETVAFYAALKGVTALAGQEWLARLELHRHLAKRDGELSGGLKQRLALALALLSDPPLLLLDEPTSNLDDTAREEFLGLLRELRAAGKTLLFTSHRSEEIAGLADRVLWLEDGRLAADTSQVTT